jgi:pimeloyl-ACP methyl ester carboxylesterase
LVPACHVYAITRRGFGKSSAPTPDRENYSADRLGDDVLAVMGALKISMPVLAGHSLAGEELSSIGTRYPGKVAGLIYLDAAYAYAFYDIKAQMGDPAVDTAELRMELEQLVTPSSPREQRERSQHLLDVSIPRVERDLQEGIKQLQSVPDTAPGPPDTPQMRIIAAIQREVEIYSGVKVPVLAIFADPHDFGPLNGTDPTKRAERVAEDLARTSARADAFQAGNPTARVVRLPNADHFVFRSNEADVLRDMNVFIATLP